MAAMEPKLSNYEVVRFLLRKGGRCTNYELVSNFRAVLNDPLCQAEARLKFKDIINRVAIVGESQDGKFIELKQEYQDNNCSPKFDQNDSGPSSIISDRSDSSGSYTSPLSQTFQPYWRYRLSSSSRVPTLPVRSPDYEFVTKLPATESHTPPQINRSVSESVLSESQDAVLLPRRSLGSVGNSRLLSEESVLNEEALSSEMSRTNGYRSYHNSISTIPDNLPTRSVSFSYDNSCDSFVRDHSRVPQNESISSSYNTPLQSQNYSYENNYDNSFRDGSRMFHNNTTRACTDYISSRSRAQSCDNSYESFTGLDNRRAQKNSTGGFLVEKTRSLSYDNNYQGNPHDENYWLQNKHEQRHSKNKYVPEYSSLDYNQELPTYLDETVGLPPPPPPPRKTHHSNIADLGKSQCEKTLHWENGLERRPDKNDDLSFIGNSHKYDRQMYKDVSNRYDINTSYSIEYNEDKQENKNTVQAHISKFSSVPQHNEGPTPNENQPILMPSRGSRNISEIQNHQPTQSNLLSIRDHSLIPESDDSSLQTLSKRRDETEKFNSSYQTNFISEQYSTKTEKATSDPNSSKPLSPNNRPQIGSFLPDKTKLSQDSNRNDAQLLSEGEPPVPPERRRRLQDKPSAETQIKADNDNVPSQREKIIMASSGKVRDRVQHFDDMEKRKNTKRSLSPLPDKENRISKGQEVEDNISISVLDPKLKKEWFVKAAQCDYHALVALLKKEPKLAGIKDIALGYTALHWAAKQGDANVVKLISGAYKVNPNVRSNGGYTPVHLATLYKHDMIVHLLVHTYGADPTIRDYSGKRADQYPDNHVRTVSGIKTIERKPLKSRPLEKEQSSSFIRIGSLNLRKSRKSAVFASVRGSTRSWGSATELRLSHYMSTRKKTPKIQIEKKSEPVIKNDSDSDSAYGFNSK